MNSQISSNFQLRLGRLSTEQLPAPAVAEERFRFDFDQFNSQVGYRSLELDNGALVMAQSSEFDLGVSS